MRIRLVGLDLDGTLLPRPDLLPPAHAEVVAQLRARGVAVAIVTGRPLLTTAWVQRALHLEGPLVCFNGGWVGQVDAAPFAAAPLREHEVRRAIAAVADLPGAVCAYPDEQSWIMDREIPYTRRWRDLYGVDIRICPERFHAWEGASWKLMFVCEPTQMAAVAALIHARLDATHQVVISQEDRLEILPLGISKAWGLAHLAERLGIAPAEVCAVGDAENDREMLTWAGLACVMGQADAALRRIAAHVLPPVEADGLTQLPALLARQEAAHG